MAFGKKSTNLIEQLGTKQSELKDTAIDKHETAAAYIAQANVLTNEAATHEAHSVAVGQALDILNKAGVQL